METVKTYKNVNSEKKNIHFGISKMETIYNNRGGKIDVPHRHNYYTVLIIKKANGFHKIDFNSYPLANRQIFFVAPGQVHQVIETEKSIGFAMTFSNQFLVENSIPLSFINSLNLFQNYGQTPPLLPNEAQFDTIENYSNQIFTLFFSHAKMKYLSIGSFLKLLLIECNDICAMNPISLDVNFTRDHLIQNFKTLVDKHYKTEHSTSYYATELHMTPDNLNRNVKTKIGKTAKEYIQSRILTEAKRLLYFTNLSNKEIGYQLGYNVPANFSAFFKKHTQLSPLNFKKKENRSE
ncbi:AraC family transcriptional regulator [Algibacter pacificus]|uniref:AraC family transcriptional regulator n=1 Tax=Algibacter pacificus TaxID=2599389 RepID=UPI0011C71659|nr:helix-turn-helix domain-containing protein [Algibacter pacificus]